MLELYFLRLMFSFVEQRDIRLAHQQMMRHVELMKSRVRPCTTSATECQICMDAIPEYGCELECGHKFHGECLHQWLNTRIEGVNPSTCPLCQETVQLLTAEPVLIRAVSEAGTQTEEVSNSTVSNASVVTNANATRAVGGEASSDENVAPATRETIRAGLVRLRAMGRGRGRAVELARLMLRNRLPHQVGLPRPTLVREATLRDITNEEPRVVVERMVVSDNSPSQSEGKR